MGYGATSADGRVSLAGPLNSLQQRSAVSLYDGRRAAQRRSAISLFRLMNSDGDAFGGSSQIDQRKVMPRILKSLPNGLVVFDSATIAQRYVNCNRSLSVSHPEYTGPKNNWSI
jgi:hypothetical protein